MEPRNFTLLFLAVNLALIVGFAAYVRGQTCTVSAVWPESLHSFHAVNPDEQNQDNGGNGFIITCKHDTKGGIDLGIGKIYGTNSYGNPLEISILQLANAELKLWFLTVGLYCWKMWIEGYYNENDEPFTLELGPWPVPHIGISPFYFWDEYTLLKDFSVSHVLVPMIGVNASFTTIGYQWRF